MKIYIEMTTVHESEDIWAFKKSIWAPEKTKKGRLWPFWSKVANVKKGDIVIHLENMEPNKGFIGYSIVSEDGQITRKSPILKEGAKPLYPSEEFIQATLKQYTPFPEVIKLKDIFNSKKFELEEYFLKNKARTSGEKLNIFYLIQNKKLQCLNGAYLSDTDDELLKIILGQNDKFYKKYMEIKDNDSIPLNENPLTNLYKDWENVDLTEVKKMIIPQKTDHLPPNNGKKKSKTDYDEREKSNCKLGKCGEDSVLDFEKERLLSLGRQDLADSIEQTSMYDDGAGYDIKSFDVIDESGNYKDRYIEVKTTTSNIQDGFYISRNELDFAKGHKNEYYLYRVYSLKKGEAKLYIYNYDELEALEKVSVEYFVKMKN